MMWDDFLQRPVLIIGGAQIVIVRYLSGVKPSRWK